LFINISETAAFPSALLCPLETQTFTIQSLRSYAGLRRILKWVKEQISTGHHHCHQHAPPKDLVFHGFLDGTTPLLLACHDGDLNMVKYLIEKWEVGVNDTAVYYKSWNWKIQEASPIFVASYNRHFSVVEYLIRKGADLSLKTTSDCEYYHHLTPLLGAIRTYYSDPFECECDYHDAEPEDAETIVLPLVQLLLENGASIATQQNGLLVWAGLPSYSVNLATLLLHHGMPLDPLNWRGETVLHNWVNLRKLNDENPWFTHISEEDSLTVVKLLVNKDANLVNNRDKKGYTPILTAAESLNWAVLDFLMEENRLDRTEHIDAMEMAAATILNQSPDDLLLERARECLRRAFLLRSEEPDPILKTPLTLESGRTIEWTTPAEVEAGIQNPREYKIQSYLTRLRIRAGRSSDSFHYSYDFVSSCFWDLLDQRRFDDIRDVLWATMDASRHNSSDDVPTSFVIVDVIRHFVSMMSQLKNDHHLFTAETFKKPLEFLLATDLFNCLGGGITDSLLQLVALLARNEEIYNDEDIKESLHQLVAKESESRTRSCISGGSRWESMLHKACLHPNDLSTICLLLRSGANPNANYYHGGPLHVLATQYRRWLVIDDKVVGNAARILLEYGAHLCQVNHKRETAAQVWKRENGDLQDLPEWLYEEKFKKLACQCARVITSQSVPYEESDLPACLHRFIEAHRYPSY